VDRIIAITDPDDPRIAPFRNIRERDLVGRAGHFIAEGKTVLSVLLGQSRHKPLALLLAEGRVESLETLLSALDAAVPVYAAPQAVLDGIAGFSMHRGVLALGARAEPFAPEAGLRGLGPKALVLVLMGIANHDNMGGIFRNAAAFGADLVLIDQTSCDPLYRKSIRVSAGGVLIVPFARFDPQTDVVGMLEQQGFQCLALSPRGEGTLAAVIRRPRMAVFLGAEGPGLPEALLARLQRVRIPMAGGFDSLNVATTSGIALHHLTRGS
jgi:tRNA G18 (ribose-2'-O)-methylase SpoU